MPLIATRGAASAQGFGEFAQASEPVYIEDVFSTYLYTGNGSTQTITNGIDLSDKGGLVWTKRRNDISNNRLYDTARGALKSLLSDDPTTELTTANSLTAFNANGFSLGSSSASNANTGTYASWTFREQPKFFDIVTYTGTGSARTVAHNLGSTPGCIIVKVVTSPSIGSSDWVVYHRSLGATKAIYLNLTGAAATTAGPWNNTEPTSTNFTLGTEQDVNKGDGTTYVAYLFAHNAGGFGLAGDQNVISCGSFNYTTFPQTVDLGYEPQWLLVKRSDGVGDWIMYDNMRGFTVQSGGLNGIGRQLLANTIDAETGGTGLYYGGATGFNLNLPAAGNYIYIAIRRGPMKTPELGTTIFSPTAINGSTGTATTTNFPVDLQIIHYRTGPDNVYWMDRLRGVNTPGVTAGQTYLLSDTTNAEGIGSSVSNGWNNTGFNIASAFASASYICWNFRRAPSFFDEVCYAGTGVARTINHNLGVVPELIIVKRRSNVSNWPVYSAPSGNTNYQYINTNSAVDTFNYWNNTSPTSTVFSVGTDNDVNGSGNTYVSYLFASCAGVSKVGSYTGTGTTQQINCGFTTGARFVMIKRTSSIGDWFVWDSARGIVAGDDPYVLMNSSAAEVTNTDYVDTYSAGFEISSTAPATINANGATFIFLAIA